MVSSSICLLVDHSNILKRIVEPSEFRLQLNQCGRRLRELWLYLSTADTMLWIKLLLTLCGCVACTFGQHDQLLQTLRHFRLSPDSHFNAAIGAKVQVSPAASAVCEQGNHCIQPWWSSSEGNIPTADSLFPAKVNTESITDVDIK